jgi:hypothetical protein
MGTAGGAPVIKHCSTTTVSKCVSPFASGYIRYYLSWVRVVGFVRVLLGSSRVRLVEREARPDTNTNIRMRYNHHGTHFPVIDLRFFYHTDSN